ncbi:hypothetical protein [uncultured Microbulbifer sp.]|uniref:hypothetical protein n=1 Tax=uncultured Microbulbifer sp. TaxID=348147 RepID=UPI0025DD9D2D|nr:hypothetical protein [uncultured Microbulbifer sp.]
MRLFSSVPLMALIALSSAAFTSGCGYLPSEMEPKPKAETRRTSDIDLEPIVHSASCGARARGYKRLGFDDLFVFTEDQSRPFAAASDLPGKYDVRAYVWGFDNCMAKGTCSQGDHYWLIKRGPEDDFTTWVVTPQYPRITIESRCKDALKVGERYRFSFRNGKLVGISKN